MKRVVNGFDGEPLGNHCVNPIAGLVSMAAELLEAPQASTSLYMRMCGKSVLTNSAYVRPYTL